MKHARDFFAPATTSNRFRMGRMRRVRALVGDVLRGQPTCSILDVGGLPAYWHCFAPDIASDPRVSITLLNLDYAEEPVASFRFERGDARDLRRFADRSFDLAHSNSVIEHVGRWADMRAMADEVCRVGTHHFVQTPYWGFPVEPHNRTLFFHWLPEQIRYRLVLRFQLGFWSRASDVDAAMRRVQSSSLVDRRQFQALFPASSIYSEIVFGLTKSLVAIGAHGAPRDPNTNTRKLRV